MIINEVPCGICNACCRKGGAVQLRPGDRPSDYKTDGKFLKRKPDGSCIHLTERGCEVYDNRPAVCRVFDCRILWKTLTRHERRKRLAAGDEILAAAKERLE